jgi:anti-sigma B factor antagonist
MLLKIHTEAHGDTLRVTLAGEFDLTAIDEFRHQIEHAPIEWQHVEIDLRDVVFMDSSGLQALVSLNNRARERGLDLTLVRPSQPVARLLALTGLDGQFTVRD